MKHKNLIVCSPTKNINAACSVGLGKITYRDRSWQIRGEVICGSPPGDFGPINIVYISVPYAEQKKKGHQK